MHKVCEFTGVVLYFTLYRFTQQNSGSHIATPSHRGESYIRALGTSFVLRIHSTYTHYIENITLKFKAIQSPDES